MYLDILSYGKTELESMKDLEIVMTMENIK